MNWQATPVSPAVAEYLSHLQADSLPLANLHHFLKFPTDTIKRESPLSNIDDGAESHLMEVNADDPDNDQVRNYSSSATQNIV